MKPTLLKSLYTRKRRVASLISVQRISKFLESGGLFRATSKTMFRRKGRSKRRSTGSTRSPPLFHRPRRGSLSPDSTATPSTTALSTPAATTQIASPSSTTEETGGFPFRRQNRGLVVFADKNEIIETTTVSATPRSRTRARMDFLSMYFPSTPRMRSGHGTDETSPVRKHSRVKKTSNWSSSDPIDNRSKSSSPTKNDDTIRDHTGHGCSDNNKIGAIFSSSTENVPQMSVAEEDTRSNDILKLSPSTQQYKMLRKARRHYSETDMGAWTAEREMSVHFLAPLADDCDSLQTIRLTPKPECTISDGMDGAPTRHQSLDEAYYAQSISTGEIGTFANNRSPPVSLGALPNGTTTTMSDIAINKSCKSGNNSSGNRDEEKERVFSFFGIKFRRQAT